MYGKLMVNRRVQTVDATLSELVANPDASFTQITAALSEFRRICTDTIHANYADASARHVEETLWATHGKINSRFRKALQELKRRGPNNAVEIRKQVKAYLDFLKVSQRSYRAFICDLDHYHGIAELRRVAKMLEPQQTRSGSNRDRSHSPELRQQLVMSCYHSLIRLGDLSRYRETECGSGTPNWGPAVGYYNLASEIYPKSGISHNQLAVIALADKSHIMAMYHLYRAIAVKEPHPIGQKNLEVEFKKISTAWDKNELIKKGHSRDGSGANKALVAWFVRLHSKCYQGEEFIGRRELEEEVIGQLTQEIKSNTNADALLQRFVTIDISAEWLAAKKIRGGDSAETTIQSFYFYMQLNVRTCTALLQALLEELEGLAGTGSPTPLVDKMSPICRRILPSLRLYCSWMTENAVILSANIPNASLMSRITEMWRVFAMVLTKGTPLVTSEKLPGAMYLLEEDVDTIEFLPLFTDKTRDTWLVNSGPKPRFNDDNAGRLDAPNEALIRLKALFITGLELVTKKQIPLVYKSVRFVYVPDLELTTGLNAIEEEPAAKRSPATNESTPKPSIVGSTPILEPITPMTLNNAMAAPLTKEITMARMVNDLVDDVEHSMGAQKGDGTISSPLAPPLNALPGSLSMLRGPSTGVGPLMTVGDLVDNVQNWHRQSSPAGASFHASQRSRNASPFVGALPSPQEQHFDAWPRPSSQASPTSSAGNGGQCAFADPPICSGLAPTPFPLESGQRLPSARNSRENSATSFPQHHLRQGISSLPFSRSSTASPYPNPIGTRPLPAAIDTSPANLSSVWGVTPHVPTADWARRQQPTLHELRSSALFGSDGYLNPTGGASPMERSGSRGLNLASTRWKT